jgi:hypothetical protein
MQESNRIMHHQWKQTLLLKKRLNGFSDQAEVCTAAYKIVV